MNNPLVSIIIVAGTGRKKELLFCLKTIFASSYKFVEVILVDNSQDKSIAFDVKKKFPNTNTVIMPENTGIFGYNIGFANAHGEFILTLDDDCSLPPKTLEKTIRIFQKKPKKVGVLTANIYNPLLKNYSTQKYTDTGIIDIPIFSGASMFRKSILEKIGYFDASFFCWQHELDLSLRVLNAGFTIHYEKDFVVHHPKGVEYRPALHYYISRNETWLAFKHFSFPYLPLLLMKNLLVLLLLPIKYKNVRALWHGLLGYIEGWVRVLSVLKKRNVVDKKIQKKFFQFHVLDRS